MGIKTNVAGEEISKDKLVIELLGSLDEASAVIGLAKVKVDKGSQKLLTRIQKDLGSFSSLLAQCKDNNIDQRLTWLEGKIKAEEKKTDIPKQFVLSGKNELEARLNLARVVVRRAERAAVKLSKQKNIEQGFLDYLNRLSWFLFLLGLESKK